ncbi:Hypothetical protein, putative [Bodo saltans]|uniref:Uncharacterized protein n=1 Tax=Bodo saltans TaxID=75058 RepID=A0A0S4JKS0_BODSA|nr:Hypothetical protein, putative [Bodo saltans]|eukprot:CUG90519.1 Hypothetical protein, putative [Bodo saltans]
MPKRSRSVSPTELSLQLEDALRRLDDELRRSHCAYEMGKKLHGLCEAAGIDSMSVFVGFVFETIAQRTVYESAFPGCNETRTWLHSAIDVNRGVEVRLRLDNTTTGTLGAVKFVSGAMLASVTTSTGVNETHPLDQWEPVASIPLYLDSMLPSGEVVVPHRSPMSVFQLCLSKLCEADKNKSKSFNAKKRIAWGLSDQASRLAFEARKEFCSKVSQAVARSITVHHQKDEASGEWNALRLRSVMGRCALCSSSLIPQETLECLFANLWRAACTREYLKSFLGLRRNTSTGSSTALERTASSPFLVTRELSFFRTTLPLSSCQLLSTSRS